MKLRHLFLSLLLATGVGFAAKANDQELYDPTPPADSAFIRLANATDSNITSQLGSVAFKDVVAPGISPYYVLKAGDYTLEAAGASQAIKVEAGKYYTVAVQKGKITPIEDALLANPAKSMIYFYNLSDAPQAALHAPAHKADIVADVASGEGKSREVNALTLDLAVMAGDKEISAFKGVELKRRTGYSFLLSGSGDALKAAQAENAVER